MEIYKKDDKIIVEIPATQSRWNSYMEEESEQGLLGIYPTLTGLIIRHKKDGNSYDEIGFAQTIDMDYADKPDQVGSFVIMWNSSEENFREKCKELNINIHEIED